MYTLKKDDDWFIDQDGVSHESPANWVWSILGGCGCGSSEDFGIKALDLLRNFAKPHDERSKDIYEDETLELLAHWMSSKGLIEHGSSVMGAWLTEEGKQINDAIETIC